MKHKIYNSHRSIVFARGVVNEHEDKVKEQIEQARRFCRSRGMMVVDVVRLENCLANDIATADALESLLDRKVRQQDYDVLVATDLSRLTRRGLLHATSTLNRFNRAGVRIVTLDDGEAGPALFRTVVYRVPRKMKVLDRSNEKEKAASHPIRVPAHDARRGTELQDSNHYLDEGNGKPRTRTQEGD